MAELLNFLNCSLYMYQRHKQPYRHILVTGFDCLLAVIRPKNHVVQRLQELYIYTVTMKNHYQWYVEFQAFAMVHCI
jgi:hypothetical protein